MSQVAEASQIPESELPDQTPDSGVCGPGVDGPGHDRDVTMEDGRVDQNMVRVLIYGESSIAKCIIY